MRGTWISIAAGPVLLLSLAATPGAGAEPSSMEAPAHPAFQRTWDRTDNPVMTGQVQRSWMWGPDGNTGAMFEQYEQSPGKVRLVQYFDKSRMEDNSWREQNAPWDVTNGLLVVELVTGNLQLGDGQFEQHDPSMVNVAGDADDPNGPTYATFQALQNVSADAAVPAITQVLHRDGTISVDPVMAAYAVPTVHYVAETQHWVAEPFWEFMTASGIVFQGGAYVTDKLFENDYYATGFPISDPFWADVKVGGVQRAVLVQCFERRCLTYTPANDPAWQVEMGNVGQHYYHWRYVEIPNKATEQCPDTDPGTYIWVADTVNNRVQKFTGTGEYVCELNGDSSGPASIDSPWSVAVNARNNDLWVHSNGWLHRFNYRGGWQTSFGNNQLLYEDIAVDTDGNVYGINASTSRVEKHSPAGDLLMHWGSSGDIAGEFDFPTGIDVDDDGNIYVVDVNNNRVSKFGPDGAFLYMWGSIDILHAPDAVAVDAAGNTYVTDQSIVVFDVNGSIIDTWEANDQWSASHGIAIAANGNVYALDRINSSVNYFSMDGTRLGGWGAYGDGPGEFDSANGIATATR